jgi:predicted nicotinamide N-methyase
LASLVGHRRGANITASDHHPLTELFLRVNLRLNGLAPMAYLHAPWDEPSGPMIELSQGHDEGEGEPWPALFDLIIGSDLLYEPDAQGALAGFISRHAAIGAEIWIIDPDRHQRAQFNRQMSQHGFARSEERIDRIAASDSTAYRGRLLTYRLRDRFDRLPLA